MMTTVICLALGISSGGDHTEGKMRVYIGTYTGKGSKGIYRLTLDLKDGSLTEDGVTEGVTNPSFLAIDPSGTHLYSVAEIATFDGKKAGGVAAFRLDPRTGNLTKLNEQSSGGPGPCHLVVDREAKNVLVANYGGGSVAVLPIDPDGKVGPTTCFIQHQGKSVNPQRQEGPHAHSINVDADNRFAFVADLGLDKVFVYQFDPNKGKLAPNDPPSASVPPGGGPRHFAWHPSGKFAYVNNELSSSVNAFVYDAKMGTLKRMQTIPTLPREVQDEEGNTTAEVQVHPSGKFVYVSNRGHDSIAVFKVDEGTGKLEVLEYTPSGGKVPRNFGIDPTGTYLLAANQDTDNVFVFRIDPKTGGLTPTGHSAKVPTPVCVKFLATKDGIVDRRRGLRLIGNSSRFDAGHFE